MNTSPAPTQAQREGVDVLAEMVTRFLGWRLPQDFMPDAGITFTPTPHQRGEYGPAEPHWPTGTNLLNYPQAMAMLEYVAGPFLVDRAQLAKVIAEMREGATRAGITNGTALSRWAEKLEALARLGGAP